MSTSRKARSTSMKQSTLGFFAAKPSAATAVAKAKKLDTRSRSSPAVSTPKAESIEDVSTPATPVESIHESSEEEQVKLKKPLPRRSGVFKSREGLENTNAAKDASVVPVGEVYDLADKEGRWNKHYGEVRKRQGYMKPIHGENQTKVHEILRVFDLSDEYGPCIGVTRMERWQRANDMDMNPPPEVYEILSTQEAREKEEYSKCVFEHEV